MKDKELRQLLEDAGVIETGCDRDGDMFINPVPIRDILNALIDYLGVKIVHRPELLVAKKKEAPQDIKEGVALQPTTAAVCHAENVKE